MNRDQLKQLEDDRWSTADNSGKRSVADLDIQFPPSMRDDSDAQNHRE